MGGLAMGECKIDKESISILKQTINIPKVDTEDYHWQCLHMPWTFLKNAQV
jgi:hypothetical protein